MLMHRNVMGVMSLGVHGFRLLSAVPGSGRIVPKERIGGILRPGIKVPQGTAYKTTVLVILFSAHPTQAHEGEVARGSDGWDRVGEGSLTGTANTSSLPSFVLVDLVSQHDEFCHAYGWPHLTERRAVRHQSNASLVCIQHLIARRY